MTWFLDLRADSVGGNPAAQVTVRKSVNPNQIINISQLVEEAKGRDVLFATHGFNVNRNDGILKLSEWESVLSLDDNTLYIGILWPGDSRWAPVIDYPFEGEEAITSAHLLAPFLNENFANTTSVSFSSHSLGARMVLV
jgi:esterase/lipase superfamily enzyme